jgi:hypothetical protein
MQIASSASILKNDFLAGNPIFGGKTDFLAGKLTHVDFRRVALHDTHLEEDVLVDEPGTDVTIFYDVMIGRFVLITYTASL